MTFALPRATLLIPADTEAKLIGRIPANPANARQPGEVRMVIVPNACHRATADTARGPCPPVPKGSSISAAPTCRKGAILRFVFVPPPVSARPDRRRRRQ